MERRLRATFGAALLATMVSLPGLALAMVAVPSTTFAQCETLANNLQSICGGADCLESVDYEACYEDCISEKNFLFMDCQANQSQDDRAVACTLVGVDADHQVCDIGDVPGDMWVHEVYYEELCQGLGYKLYHFDREDPASMDCYYW